MKTYEMCWGPGGDTPHFPPPRISLRLLGRERDSAGATLALAFSRKPRLIRGGYTYGHILYRYCSIHEHTSALYRQKTHVDATSPDLHLRCHQPHGLLKLPAIFRWFSQIQYIKLHLVWKFPSPPCLMRPDPPSHAKSRQGTSSESRPAPSLVVSPTAQQVEARPSLFQTLISTIKSGNIYQDIFTGIYLLVSNAIWCLAVRICLKMIYPHVMAI